jgi:hypothetical protein
MTTNYVITTNEIKNELYNNVISQMFPNLNTNDKNILANGLYLIIDLLCVTFNMFDTRDLFLRQLRQNNYNDTFGLLLLLLPFINDDDGSKKKELNNLNELYITKMSNVKIDEKTPKYKYSNIQYNRCIRDKIQEITFDKKHFEQNLILLLDTIKYVSNKLYVNWIDVLPISLNEVKSLPIYKYTENKIINHQIVDWNPLNIYEYNNELLGGLSVDIIYETITNDFFESIKNIKWLIYDINNNNGYSPLILILSNILNLNKMIEYNKKYENITDEQRESFDKIWLDMINKYNSSENIIVISLSQTVNFGINNYLPIIKSLIMFFDKYYSEKEEASDDGYISLGEKYKNINDDEEAEFNVVKDNNINQSINSIKGNVIKHIYNYIFECITKFKLTYYGKKLIINNEIVPFTSRQSILDLISVSTGTILCTYKNLYNLGKSLCHYTNNNEYLMYPTIWRSLTKIQKQDILGRLNINSKTNNIQNWFNISRYIKKIYDINESMYVIEYNNAIFDFLQKNLTNYIFESMIIKGILSCFIPKANLTDTKLIGEKSNIPSIIKQDVFSQDGKYWNGAYYYLTGEKYSDMNTFNKKIKDITYKHWFDYNSSKDGRAWYSAYALNWVSQINFFHRYLNNRIIYTTGSTGVGKSTQVPKLLLYALKAIDYKNNGKIICSQPRQAPTQNNANIISLEMGVPIINQNEKNKEGPSNNFSIQYKHKVSKHINSQPGLTLSIVTDGLLIKEVMNPLLKKKNRDGQEIYTDNSYDIVIVDEAHEHNTNMDMILTFMKDALYYNNDIRLVIVSATMDDDEPIYRRYYRDINDNRLMPLSYHIWENKLDRINVDRRLHISPPGQTTRYRIDDYYVPGNDPIEQAIKVANETNNGDILLFEPGSGEIKKALDDLNAKTPPNMIAIPFYSDMPDEIRTFVQDIDDNKRKIKMSKIEPFEYIDKITTGSNSYSRVLIVATNIAEASITIDGLKYVIETGSQKTNIYDYKLGSSVLKLTPISESSRLQRRGRVGRTGPGSVYYMYKKGAMEETVSQYKINNEDLKLILFNYLIDNNKTTPLFNLKNDPNKNIINISTLKKMYTNGTHEIIMNQYFIGKEFYAYYGDDTQYDYSNSKVPHTNYFSKYTYDTLNDPLGDFYIIHPNENSFIRNLVGQIKEITEEGKKNGISFNANYENYLIFDKMNSFWDILKNINLIDNQYRKTVYGVLLYQLFEKLEGYNESFEQLISFVYSLVYECDEDIIRIFSMLRATRGEIRTIIEGKIINEKYRDQTESVKKLFGNDSKGEIFTILNIVNQFHKYIENKLNINYDSLKDTIILNLKNHILGQKQDELLEELIKTNSINNSTILDDKAYNKLIQTKYIEELIQRKLYEIKEDINTICNQMNIKSKTIFDYFKNYFILKKNKTVMLTLNKKDINITLLFNQIKKISIYINNPIIGCLLHGFPYNTVKQMGNSKFYISTYKPFLENVYSFPLISKGYAKNQIICDDKYLSDYVLYLNMRLDNKTIHFSSYVTEDEIKNIYQLYGCSYCNKTLPTIMATKINIPTDFNVLYNILYLYTHTLNELRNLCDYTKIKYLDCEETSISEIPLNMIKKLIF